MPQEGSEEPQEVYEDALAVDQAARDSDLAGEPAPQFVTLDQYNALLGQNQTLKNHLNGLEQRIDRGINGLQSNLEMLTAEAAKQEITRREQELLASIDDPDERQRMQTMLELQALRNPKPVSQPTQQPTQQVAQQPATQNEAEAWAQVQQFVRNSGVDPNDPSIDYAVLVDATKTAEQRQQVFMSSLVTAARNQGQKPPQQPATPSVQEQAPAASPQRAAGRAGSSGFKNVMDVYEAYAKGHWDTDAEGKAAYRAELAKFGVKP